MTHKTETATHGRTTYTGPLPSYDGCELMEGRARTALPRDYVLVALDASGHDPGDECRGWRCRLPPPTIWDES